MAIMTPRREAHRKVRKGKNEGTASRCNYVAFGDWGLMSLDNERVTSRQIEAARQAITRYVKRGGKIWIRISRTHQLPRNHLMSRWVVVKVSHSSTSPRSKLAP